MVYALVGQAATTAMGRTIRDGYATLGRELGWFRAYTVSDEAASGLIGGAEPRRFVVLEELEDDEESTARLDGAYLYVRTGDQAGTQRRLTMSGYDGPIGAVAVSRLLDAPLEAGDIVEISRPLPVRDHFDRRGLWELTAEAAERSVVEARIALTGDGTRGISLNGYGFITSYDQTRGIFDYRLGGVSTDPYGLSPYGYNLKQNGADVTLEPSVTYASGESFQLSVAVPGHRLLHDGAAWAYVGDTIYTTTATDSYQSVVPLHWTRVFGMLRALDHLISLTLDDPTLSDDAKKRRIADYERRMGTYSGAAARIITNEFSRPPQDVAPGLATVTTTTTDGGWRGGGAWGGGWPG